MTNKQKKLLLQQMATKLFGPASYVEDSFDDFSIYTERWGICFDSLLKFQESGFKILDIYKDGYYLMFTIDKWNSTI